MSELAVDTATRSPLFYFDIFADPRLRLDVHEGYLQLKSEAPGLFWTPVNGGHWVALASPTILHIMQHPELFSNSQTSIPKRADAPRMIPESLDPPEHRQYRQFLRPWFESSAIAEMEPRVAEWTEQLVARIAPQGECEFVEEVGSRLPVSIFMEMFGLPLARIDEFRDLITGLFSSGGSVEDQQRYAAAIGAVLAELIQVRMAEPADDLVSKLIAADFDGRKLAFDELMSIGFLMFLAGLDTVTNAMTFGFRHLAQDNAMQQALREQPDKIPHAVEELLRRYGFANVPRLVMADTELDGVLLREGDMVHCALPMVGLDDALNPEAQKVSLERNRHRHAAFGNGVHTCLGLHLARLELKTLYRVWLERVGPFRLRADAPPTSTRGGTVMAQTSLWLQWAAN
jgi:cytochrome P450